MRYCTLGLVISWLAVTGCSGGLVPVSGVVKTKSGQAVTGVLLVLMPVEGPRAKTRAFSLDAQGAFQGEAAPGVYTYYISQMSVETDEDGKPVKKADVPAQKANEQAFRRIPAPYRTYEGAGPERRVEVKSGASFTLELGT